MFLRAASWSRFSNKENMYDSMPYVLCVKFSDRTQRGLAIAGLMACLTALLAELTLHITGHVAQGGNVLGALLGFISYYTVGSNILLVAIYAAYLAHIPARRILQDARVRAMAAAMITLVMLVYLFILSRVEAPQGLGKISVILAHYIAPPLYLAWWAASSHGDQLSVRDLPLMMAPSIAYMSYVLLLGHLTGSYPYAMLDADRLSPLSMVVHGLGPGSLLRLHSTWALALRARADVPRKAPARRTRPRRREINRWPMKRDVSLILFLVLVLGGGLAIGFITAPAGGMPGSPNRASTRRPGCSGWSGRCSMC